MGVTICFLTYERKDLAWSTLEANLKRAGSIDYELMICDNGTQDQEFLDRMNEHFKPTYFRRNKWNEGIARALNQLILRRSKPHAMFMPNDILLGQDWLKISLEYLNDIEPSGVVGFEDPNGLSMPKTTLTGKSGKIYDVFCEKDFKIDGCQVMGATIFPYSLIETIGYLDEDLGANYGFEDQLICFRAKILGLENYYIANVMAEHLGVNEEITNPDYKLPKEQMLIGSVGYFRWRTQNLLRLGVYKGPPIKRPPYQDEQIPPYKL